MLEQAVLPEELPVIGEDHHERIVVGMQIVEGVDQATNLFVFEGDAAIVSVPFVPHVVRRIRAMPVSPAIQYASRVGFGGETAPKGSRREVGGVGIEVIQ